MNRIFKKIIAVAALIITGIFIPKYASSHPDVVETLFSEGLYIHIRKALGALSSLVPFSLTEFFIFALIIAVIVLIIILIVRIVKGKTTWSGFLQTALSFLLTGAIVLNVFYFAWGFNYMRPMLYELLSLEKKERTSEELYSLCMELKGEAEAQRVDIHTNDDGIFEISDGGSACFPGIVEAYGKAHEREPIITAEVIEVKPVYASGLMSSAGISGLFMPVLTEANVNTDQPSLLIPFTAAHETAHYTGFAREDEANFIAYLVCRESRSADIRYSGAVGALLYCAAALREDSPKLYSELIESMSAGLTNDIKAYNAYWAKMRGGLSDAVNSLNDGYLKFNKQEDGVLSYGGIADLLLAYREKQG